MQHHLHIRKRLSQKKLEPYPSKNFWIHTLDKVVLALGVLGPVMALPQLELIYIEHQAAGVSVLSWTTWAFMNIPWVMYGVVHKERPIVVTYTLWFFINGLVAIGALLYS